MTEIVAEISCNHGGKIENAFRLIEAAANAGADAVKFQCFMPDRVVERRKSHPLIAELMKAYDKPYAELVAENWTPWGWFPELIALAGEHRLKWLSSVFDPHDVAFLEMLDCPRYKISAFEMFAWDILKAVQETGKPYIVSVRPTPGVTIMEATHYDGTFEPLGLSAHGPIIPAGKVPMVEYHLKLPDVPTADDAFSLTPAMFAAVVRQIRKLQ